MLLRSALLFLVDHTVLRYTALHCAVLCCTVLCCVILCCAALHCAVLCCAALCCAVLHCAVLHCAVLCCAVLCCAVLCCAALHCVVLCCVVLCCAVQCCTAVLCCFRVRSVLLCFAVPLPFVYKTRFGLYRTVTAHVLCLLTFVFHLGVFTVNHVTGKPMVELVRVVKPGGLICFSVREDVYHDKEYCFQEVMAELEQQGKWKQLTKSREQYRNITSSNEEQIINHFYLFVYQIL